jgi:acyl-CoA thioesterase I
MPTTMVSGFRVTLRERKQNMKQITAIASLLFTLLLAAGCTSNAEKVSGNNAGNKNTDQSPATIKTILFFGNSLTAGYGLDPSEAFPALIQQKIDSAKLPYKVVNAGVSGETSSGGNARIDWILKQPVDVFILELGANDGLRGIPVDETKRNLQAIIDKVKTKYPNAKLVLAGMQVPPNMGQAYATRFRSMFPELASANNMTLVPFLLEGVGGVRELNLQDGIHPTAEGHKIVANTVWGVLQGVIRE